MRLLLPHHWLKTGTGLLAGMLLSGCQTTGDPNAGGLLGWSEQKAQQRLADRSEALSQGRHELAGEHRQTRQLAQRRRELSDAEAAERSRPKSLQVPNDSASFTRALREAEMVEETAPTSSGASRARRLRGLISAVQADRSLDPETRAARLRSLERELARLRVSLGL